MVRPGRDQGRYLAETEDRPGGQPAVTRPARGPNDQGPDGVVPDSMGPDSMGPEAAATRGPQQRPFGQDRIRADAGDLSAQGDGFDAAIRMAREQQGLTEEYLGRGVPVRPPDGSTP